MQDGWRYYFPHIERGDGTILRTLWWGRCGTPLLPRHSIARALAYVAVWNVLGIERAERWGLTWW